MFSWHFVFQAANIEIISLITMGPVLEIHPLVIERNRLGLPVLNARHHRRVYTVDILCTRYLVKQL